jgi:D-lactate dehydrogenase (cytochrome)/glycolate oxidase
VTAPWLEELTEAAGARVVTDPDVLAAHARDHAPFVAAGRAACLVRATGVEDVVGAMTVAQRHRVPVVTRGAGSGLAGGANAIDGCIVLDVAGMDRILSIDPATRTAVVEPGVINGDLDSAAGVHGLTYAPDPASRAYSTIGGNIATNAGGACCLKYGVTGDHVAALAVVLADGTRIRTGTVAAKDVAGLDLTSLLVGSEGTLGVIVEATLRLLPRAHPPATLAAFFATTEDAGRAVVAMQTEAALSLVELMDKATVTAVEAHARMQLDIAAGALVIAQADTPTAAADIDRCAEVCTAHGATDVVATGDADEGGQLLAARRLALPALEQLGTTLLDDVAVPTPALPKLLTAITDIAEQHGVVIGTFGHAGDGNMHPTIVFDPTDEDAVAAAQAAFAAIVRTAVALGGTVSGEHGVGTLKRSLLTELTGTAELALMHRIKAAFDPRGILNPGKGY